VLRGFCDARIEMLDAARTVARRTVGTERARKVMLSLSSHPATEANRLR
jgi:hypothetical protein